MSKGFLIYEEMRKYLVIYEEAFSHDFATASFWISLYMRNIFYFLLSVNSTYKRNAELTLWALYINDYSEFQCSLVPQFPSFCVNASVYTMYILYQTRAG